MFDSQNTVTQAQSYLKKYGPRETLEESEYVKFYLKMLFKWNNLLNICNHYDLKDVLLVSQSIYIYNGLTPEKDCLPIAYFWRCVISF